MPRAWVETTVDHLVFWREHEKVRLIYQLLWLGGWSLTGRCWVGRTFCGDRADGGAFERFGGVCEVGVEGGWDSGMSLNWTWLPCSILEKRREETLQRDADVGQGSLGKEGGKIAAENVAIDSNLPFSRSVISTGILFKSSLWGPDSICRRAPRRHFIRIKESQHERLRLRAQLKSGVI